MKINNRVKAFSLSVVLVLVITSLFSIVSITTNEVKAELPTFDGHYYGYGDSIMEQADSFLVYMVQTYDPTNTSSLNNGGGGQNSTWGLAHWHDYVEPGNMTHLTIEQYGTNDCYYGAGDGDLRVEPKVSAQNKLRMYNYSVENQTSDRYFPCVPTLASNIADRPLWYQHAIIKTNENNFRNFSVRYIKLYDAIDTVPWNGKLDEWDSSNYRDVVHPNTVGAYKMAALCWYIINGYDYNETYYPDNDTISVTVDYNESIYIEKRSDWSWEDITVTCITNSTEIGWNISKNISKVEKYILIEGVKGSIYEITGSNKPQFIAIEGETNGSTIYDSTPTINWTILDNASHYHLEIDNNADFCSPEVNLSEINQWNYPSNCLVNTTRVSFTLPDANALDKNYYYMRVKGLA